MSILQKLYRIQQGAVSPKDKDNGFAGFKYRNVEGILRNCKPIFKQEQVYCKLSDEVVEVNGQAYVKATAILYDCESGENISAALSSDFTVFVASQCRKPCMIWKIFISSPHTHNI